MSRIEANILWNRPSRLRPSACFQLVPILVPGSMDRRIAFVPGLAECELVLARKLNIIHKEETA